MWTRNYGALGQTARVCFGVLCANRTRERTGGKKRAEKKDKRVRERERTEGGGETERDGKRVGERESDARLEWKKGLSPEIGVKKTMNAGGVEYNRKNQKLIFYPDNVPSAMHFVLHGPNILVTLPPTELQKFLGISEVKLTEGIFVGSDIRKLMKDNEFETYMTANEKEA
ncbi:hypothetical protein TNCV_3172261 [Trichonephila clavipes]|nr:hypothetical protein TNCV_3172261 [Trichonephila clavipes]